MEKHTFYRPAENCIRQEMGDDVLLFNPETTNTIHLNQTADLIWQLCKDNSIETLIEGLQTQYPDQSEQIKKDVLETVDSLVQQQVLTLIETNPS